MGAFLVLFPSDASLILSPLPSPSISELPAERFLSYNLAKVIHVDIVRD